MPSARASARLVLSGVLSPLADRRLASQFRTESLLKSIEGPSFVPSFLPCYMFGVICLDDRRKEVSAQQHSCIAELAE